MSEQDFESFVRRASPALLKTAWLLTGDVGHSQDVVQTALERTARHWSRLHGAPEAYARRAVVNASTDRFRRRRARVTEVGSAQHDVETGSDPVGELVLRDALVAAVRQLPSRQRTVLVLRYLLDLDVHETAGALGVSAGTVTSSSARGLIGVDDAPTLIRMPEPDSALSSHRVKVPPGEPCVSGSRYSAVQT